VHNTLKLFCFNQPICEEVCEWTMQILKLERRVRFKNQSTDYTHPMFKTTVEIAIQLLKRLKKHRDQAVEISIFGHLLFHLFSGVQDCGVMFAKLLANFRQRRLGELAAQIHCDLPGFGDPSCIVLRFQFSDPKFEMFRNNLLNLFDVNVPFL
jgi:hypothetical protein